jgi:hypothetical protein
MARRIPRYQREANQASERAKPPRRVAADLLEQGPTTSLSGCPLFYEDLEFTCIDCGVDEVWTASDQKWWYETVKGNLLSTAKRCTKCRNALQERHNGTPRRSHRDRREQSSDE